MLYGAMVSSFRFLEQTFFARRLADRVAIISMGMIRVAGNSGITSTEPSIATCSIGSPNMLPSTVSKRSRVEFPIDRAVKLMVIVVPLPVKACPRGSTAITHTKPSLTFCRGVHSNVSGSTGPSVVPSGFIGPWVTPVAFRRVMLNPSLNS